MKTTIIINGVSAEVELTPDQAELFEVKKFGRQRVKRGVVYWYLICCGEIGNSSENNDGYDKERFERGNYFLSKEDAEAHDNYNLAVVKVNDRIDQLNQGWKMVWDWKNTAVAIYYSYFHGYIRPDTHSYCKFSSVLHYGANNEIVEQIIQELTPELEVIFNYQL